MFPYIQQNWVSSIVHFVKWLVNILEGKVFCGFSSKTFQIFQTIYYSLIISFILINNLPCSCNCSTVQFPAILWRKVKRNKFAAITIVPAHQEMYINQFVRTLVLPIITFWIQTPSNYPKVLIIQVIKAEIFENQGYR